LLRLEVKERKMFLRIWRLVTIVLAALSLTMESAHLLELPQKLHYTEQMYSAVNTTLYRYFAIIGGMYQIGSIAMALILVYLVRERRPSFQWTMTGALFLAAALAIWIGLVEPVNRQIGSALRDMPDSVPALWQQVRNQWEFGHAAGFFTQLIGFCALMYSVLVETPERLSDVLQRSDAETAAAGDWAVSGHPF
jgi:hypothetical protein